MLLAERWRLEQPDSLDLFLTWRSMGAQPPTLGELLALPSWIVRDFQKLSVRFYKAKERKRKLDEQKKKG